MSSSITVGYVLTSRDMQNCISRECFTDSFLNPETRPLTVARLSLLLRLYERYMRRNWAYHLEQFYHDMESDLQDCEDLGFNPDCIFNEGEYQELRDGLTSVLGKRERVNAVPEESMEEEP